MSEPGKKNTGLLKGLLTITVLAVLVFVVIYFFFPDTSIRYFGVAFDREKAVEETITVLLEKVDYVSADEKEKVEEYLSSGDGKKFIKEISTAISGGADSIRDFTSTDSFKSFEKRMQEILSPESYRKLTEAVEDGASGLLEKLF